MAIIWEYKVAFNANFCAFVKMWITSAFDPASCEALGTVTVEAALSVGTGGSTVAVVRFRCTFIDVFTTNTTADPGRRPGPTET